MAVIMSEVDGSRSEAATQSKDPLHSRGATACQEFEPRLLMSDFANIGAAP